MAQPIVLQENFTRMIQDVPRDELPDDAAWAIVDFLPNIGLMPSGVQGGRLTKRGGWKYATTDISLTMSSASSINSIGYFRNSNRLCFTTDNSKFGYITPGSLGATPTQVTSSGALSLQNFVEHSGKLIIPVYDGTTTPKYYDGTTFGSLGGSPPAGKYASVWKDRTILGGSAAQPRRTYFSSPADPTTWDTTNGWQDVIQDIKGYAALQSALLVFGPESTARFRGTTPPGGSQTGDLYVDDPLFNIGCPYPRSIAVNAGVAVFANQQGVYVTSGAGQPQDLTAQAGIKSFWQRFCAKRAVGIGDTVADIAGGFISNYYFCVVTKLEGSSNKGFLFNLADRSCVVLTNVRFSCAAMTPEIGDELYFGMSGSPYLVAMSPIFSSSYKADDNGTAVQPELHTRYYLDARTDKKTWRNVYVDYRLDDAASDNPAIGVAAQLLYQSIEGGASTPLPSLSETTSGATIRAKLPIRKHARGICFEFVQGGNSANTTISALLADVHGREGGRV